MTEPRPIPLQLDDGWIREAMVLTAAPEERLPAQTEATALKVAELGDCVCPTPLAQVEFRDRDHPSYQALVNVKQGWQPRMRGPADPARARDPDPYALALEGAVSARSYLGAARAADALRRWGALLIVTALAMDWQRRRLPPPTAHLHGM